MSSSNLISTIFRDNGKEVNFKTRYSCTLYKVISALCDRHGEVSGKMLHHSKTGVVYDISEENNLKLTFVEIGAKNGDIFYFTK